MPSRVRAASAPPRTRVIVIGAGFGGATCARYLKKLSPATEVILIDRRPAFFTGPFSNLVITGLRRPGSIERRVPRIGAAHGVTAWVDEVIDIDPATVTVTTAAGKHLAADRLVVAPGIELRFDAIPGLDAAASQSMPHAWLGDAQVLTLRDRLAAVPDGATVLIASPPNPYRCPPGPYERASLFAHALKTSGRTRAKILIADAKDDFSLSALFRLEWDTLYPGMIDWLPRSSGGDVVRVDPAAGAVWLRGAAAPLEVALASVIPAQRAAGIAARADLIDESGWCPVDPADFQSTRHPRVHVLGDACIGAPMPKSGFAANSQAKLCAAAIVAALRGLAKPDPRLINTCYSLVSADEAISVSGSYAAADGKLGIVAESRSPLAGDVALRRTEGRQARAWYDAITADSFGRPA